MVLKLPGAPCKLLAVLNSFSKSACDFALPLSSEAPALKPRMSVSCANAPLIEATASASVVANFMIAE